MYYYVEEGELVALKVNTPGIDDKKESHFTTTIF